jgi:hypothetical protein
VDDSSKWRREIMMQRLLAVFSGVSLLAAAGQAYASDPNTWTWKTLDYPGAASTRFYSVDGSNIAGTYNDSSGGCHAFLFDGTTWTNLGDLPDADWMTTGLSGVRVLAMSLYSYSGMVYDGTTWTEWTHGTPWGMEGNNVVGADSNHAFFYDGTTWTTLNYPGAAGTFATDISGNNIVGVHKYYAMDFRGFLYDGTTWTGLDYPGAATTFPVSISGHNIVGAWDYDLGSLDASFLYDGTTWTCLWYPGSYGTYVYGISGNTIVGYYGDLNYHQHGFILTIPEPATLSVLALGGLALMRWRR